MSVAENSSGSRGGGEGEEERMKSCFLEWMELQKQDLREMEEAMSSTQQQEQLTGLAQKAVSHFESYIRRRSDLWRGSASASAFFAPSWCTAWETSLLWIAGCRPSSYFRLIYSLCGTDIQASLPDFLAGAASGVHLGYISSHQLRLIDDLHRRTIADEDRLTSRLAALQEDVADHPVSTIANVSASWEPGMTADVRTILDAHERSMASSIEAADRLRLDTVKKILEILTPIQGVELLAASKKLHLCIHEWSKLRQPSSHPHP